jgi:hypothetical protein
MELDVQKLLEDSLPSMMEGFRAEIKSSVNWQVKDTVGKLVTDHVIEWVSANVLPEITAALVESKESIVSTGAALGPQVVTILTEGLLENLKKNLENSWKRDKVMEALFKS